MPKAIIKKVPITNEKVVVVHECNQVEKLARLLDNTNKLSIIITGNGDPEKGLCSQLAIVAERQKGVLAKLDKIHNSLDGYHTEIETAKDVAETVKSAFDIYKAETIGVRKGRDEVSTQGQVKFVNVINIISTILVMIGLIITVINSNKKIEVLETNQIRLMEKVDNLGTPVIVNQRGKIDKLPDGDSLKYFKDGEFKNFK